MTKSKKNGIYKTAYIFAGVNGAGKSTLYWNESEKDCAMYKNLESLLIYQ